MKGNKMYHDEQVEMSKIIIWVMFSIILVIIIGLVFASVRVAFMDLERDAIQKSHSYTEGNVTQLQVLYDEYLDLETQIIEYRGSDNDYSELIGNFEAQQSALINRIDTIASRIDDDEIPEAIKELLNEQ